MGSGGGGQSAPQETTQTSTTELPDFVKAPAKRYLGRAEDLSQGPFETYQGQRVAGLNSFHQAALDGGRVAAGNLLPSSIGVMDMFARGGFNQPAYIHPYLGPQAQGFGTVPGGYTGGSTQPGFQGYPPQPMPGLGMGGKGGAIPAPTPVPITPLPPGLGEIAAGIPPIAAPPAAAGGAAAPAPVVPPQYFHDGDIP